MHDPFEQLGPPTAEFPGDTPRARFDRAVAYHQAADLLLQHRLNTFIVAQAFLAGAFFTSHVPEAPSAFLVSARLALVALALAYCVAFFIVTWRMTGGLERLKALLLRDPVFAAFYLPSGSTGRRSRWTRWLNPLIPSAAFAFWIAVAIAGA
ncbi:MAG: hypothetical protein AB7O56_02210 [Bauldia sp.]